MHNGNTPNSNQSMADAERRKKMEGFFAAEKANGEPNRVGVDGFACFADYLSTQHSQLYRYPIHLPLDRDHMPNELIVFQKNAQNFGLTRTLQGAISRDIADNKRLNLGKDVFAYPVYMQSNHWALVVVDRKKKTVEYYNSYASRPLEENALGVDEALAEVAATFGKEDGVTYTIQKKVTKVLQQGVNNTNECGAFVCHFLEERLQNDQYDPNKEPEDITRRIATTYRQHLIDTLAPPPSAAPALVHQQAPRSNMYVPQVPRSTPHSTPYLPQPLRAATAQVIPSSAALVLPTSLKEVCSSLNKPHKKFKFKETTNDRGDLIKGELRHKNCSAVITEGRGNHSVCTFAPTSTDPKKMKANIKTMKETAQLLLDTYLSSGQTQPLTISGTNRDMLVILVATLVQKKANLGENDFRLRVIFTPEAFEALGKDDRGKILLNSLEELEKPPRARP